MQVNRLEGTAIKNLQTSMFNLQKEIENLDKEVDDLESNDKLQDTINEIYGAYIVKYYFANQNLAISTLKLNESNLHLLPISTSIPNNWSDTPILLTTDGPISGGPLPSVQYPIYTNPDDPIAAVYIVQPTDPPGAIAMEGDQGGFLIKVTSSTEYLKMLRLSTYISIIVGGSSSDNGVIDPTINLDGQYPGYNPNWYGCNELYSSYPVNVPGFNKNSGQPANFRSITDLPQEILNIIGSVSTCSGAAWILSSFFGSPESSSLPYPASKDLGAQYIDKPYTGTNEIILSTINVNNSKQYCPSFSIDNFEMINLAQQKTYAERFLAWAGFDEDNVAAGFTNITSPSLINKLNIYLGLVRLFRYEKLMQYGLFQIPVDEVADMAFKTQPVSALSITGHPTYSEMMTNFKSLSEELLSSVNNDIDRIKEVLPVNFSDCTSGTRIY